jgi:hypothetical protein
LAPEAYLWSALAVAYFLTGRIDWFSPPVDRVAFWLAGATSAVRLPPASTRPGCNHARSGCPFLDQLWLLAARGQLTDQAAGKTRSGLDQAHCQPGVVSRLRLTTSSVTHGLPVSCPGRGKPLLVNFVYTGCFDVCPTSSRALYKAVDAMRGRFGFDQFQVVTIGFNQPTDTPLAMRDFAARLRITDTNWEFLSPRAEDVAALTRDFGFSYVATPMGYDQRCR